MDSKNEPKMKNGDTDESDTDSETVKKPSIPNCFENYNKYENKWSPPRNGISAVTAKPVTLEKQKHLYSTYFKKFQNVLNYKTPLALLLVFGMVYWSYCNFFNGDKRHITLEDLKTAFPNQDEQFWITINSSIKLAADYNEPSTLIYLYTEETRDTVRQILNMVAKYTQNVLNVEDYSSIDVDSAELNAIGISDYGQILDQYRPQLEKKRIMTVHDFDQLHGSVAQAFHWFCDQYTPVIPKAVFQFTIKVDQIVPKQRLIALVDQILVDKWAEDLNKDLLYPLIARVTGMVLSVRKEPL